MIVDPDFLDHWRVGMVADAIGDPMAPLYILRLWAHCQERKAVRFVMPPAGLKAQCKCPADAALFEAALIEAGFLERDGAAIVVLGWAEKNAALIAAWENGAKGGRPKKNPSETHGKPTGNPRVTQPEPMGNPDETDKSREDKSSSSLRSEEQGGAAPKPPARRKAAAPVAPAPLPDWIDQQAWDGFEAMRKATKKPLTDAARRLAVSRLADMRDEGQDVAEVLRQSTFRCWAGLFPVKAEAPAPQKPQAAQTFRERDAALAKADIDRLTGRAPRQPSDGREVIDITPRTLELPNA